MEKVKDNVYRLTPEEWDVIKTQGAILEIPINDKEVWASKGRGQKSIKVKPRLY